MVYISKEYDKYDFKSCRAWREEGVYEPFVYMIEELETGIKYIGSRFAKRCLESDLGSLYFTSSKRVVWESEEFQIISIIPCASNHDAIILESNLIECCGAVYSDDFYNEANWSVGDCGGYVRTKENKEKISRSLKEHFRDNDGTFKGRRHSRSSKKKISEARMGAIVSEETRIKISNSGKGRKAWNKGLSHSDESKKKMSASRKGKEPWNKNKTGVYSHTEETRKKMSESNKGKKKVLGRKWICKGQEVKYVMKEDLNEYIHNGWILGRKDNRGEL